MSNYFLSSVERTISGIFHFPAPTKYTKIIEFF